MQQRLCWFLFTNRFALSEKILTESYGISIIVVILLYRTIINLVNCSVLMIRSTECAFDYSDISQLSIPSSKWLTLENIMWTEES